MVKIELLLRTVNPSSGLLGNSVKISVLIAVDIHL